MKLSVITVVLNGEKHIKQCIESVVSQKTNDVEYIIVDGGSTDGTLEIIRSFEPLIDRIISEPDHGIADGFNKGIQLSTGDVIGFINADDWMEEGAVAHLLNRTDQADIYYARMRVWMTEKRSFVATADHNQLRIKMTLNHPSVFVNRSVYEVLGGFNAYYSVAMDYEFLLRALASECEFSDSKYILTNMRWGGVSDKEWIKGIKEVRRAKDEMLGPSWLHVFDAMKQVLETGASRWLLQSAFAGLFARYRSRYSSLPKFEETRIRE